MSTGGHIVPAAVNLFSIWLPAAEAERRAAEKNDLWHLECSNLNEQSKWQQREQNMNVSLTLTAGPFISPLVDLLIAGALIIIISAHHRHAAFSDWDHILFCRYSLCCPRSTAATILLQQRHNQFSVCFFTFNCTDHVSTRVVPVVPWPKTTARESPPPLQLSPLLLLLRALILLLFSGGYCFLVCAVGKVS